MTSTKARSGISAANFAALFVLRSSRWTPT
jgi:hypothetical protein